MITAKMYITQGVITTEFGGESSETKEQLKDSLKKFGLAWKASDDVVRVKLVYAHKPEPHTEFFPYCALEVLQENDWLVLQGPNTVYRIQAKQLESPHCDNKPFQVALSELIRTYEAPLEKEKENHNANNTQGVV